MKKRDLGVHKPDIFSFRGGSCFSLCLGFIKINLSETSFPDEFCYL